MKLIDTISEGFSKSSLDLPMGNLSEEQIEEKANEMADKIKELKVTVKNEFLEAVRHIPLIGEKFLKRLEEKKLEESYAH